MLFPIMPFLFFIAETCLCFIGHKKDQNMLFFDVYREREDIGLQLNS
jgi:hypothetical protein